MAEGSAAYVTTECTLHTSITVHPMHCQLVPAQSFKLSETHKATGAGIWPVVTKMQCHVLVKAIRRTAGFVAYRALKSAFDRIITGLHIIVYNLVSIERVLLWEAYEADGTNVRLDVVKLHVSLKPRLLPEDSVANVTNVLEFCSAIAARPLVYTLVLL